MRHIKSLPIALLATALCSLVLAACSRQEASTPEPEASADAIPVSPIEVSAESWGELNGETVTRYTLVNEHGMEVRILNWGAYVQSIRVPDREGQIEEVLVGYDDWDAYLNDCCYAGPIVGRFGNRIDQARFTIDGETYQLTVNDGPNQLHGGVKGLHKRMWTGKIVDGGVELNYLSADGEEGYPGNLDITVTYTLDDSNALTVSYSATTDKATHVNLTSHTYFNLSGDRKRNIEAHELMIAADHISEVDDELIPTGRALDVADTPFDFNTPTAIGERIRVEDEQLKKGGGVDATYGGYDHNWIFAQADGRLRRQVTLFEPESGRFLEIYTEEPAIQFYSGNFMDGSMIGRGGRPVQHREGLALEPQHFPDSPNQDHFPSTRLEPGDTYSTQSVYRFSVLD